MLFQRHERCSDLQSAEMEKILIHEFPAITSRPALMTKSSEVSNRETSTGGGNGQYESQPPINPGHPNPPGDLSLASREPGTDVAGGQPQPLTVLRRSAVRRHLGSVSSRRHGVLEHVSHDGFRSDGPYPFLNYARVWPG
jgi:hypothetical protein